MNTAHTSRTSKERLIDLRTSLQQSNYLQRLSGLTRVMNYDDWDMWDMWGSQSLTKRTKHRSSTEKTQLVIIQPTPFCNINCDYCYLPNRNVTHKISEDTLAKIYARVFSSPHTDDALNFVWHTGEPLVMPIAFYRKAFELMDAANTKKVKTVNSFQTNAMLITQEWCDLFQRDDIDIGVSLDGPQFLHDKRRKDRKGRGTFETAMQGIRLLQENNIRFSTISVLTDESLDHAEDIWDFFVANNITRVCFNVEEVEGINQKSTLQAEHSVDRFKAFFRRIIELNQRDPEISVRELDFYFGNILFGSEATPVLSTENKPFVIVAFDYNGQISTFSPELLTMSHERFSTFTFGNVDQTGIQDLISNEQFQEIHSEIQQGVQRCEHECDYFHLCGGGPPVNKLFETGRFDSTETMYCKLKVKSLIETVFEYLEEQHQIPHSMPTA